MRINRRKLIRFYDERSKEDGRGSDVSALTGFWGEDMLFGVLQHYWTKTEGAESEILSYSCTTGKKEGHRLDGWLLKRSHNSRSLYQVEIKNWGAYSLGERPLKLDATAQEIEAYCREQWLHYFGNDTIPDKSVAKVLLPMEKPLGYEDMLALPLLGFWFFIAEDLKKPFSMRHLSDGKAVYVFSASAYLRSLKDDFIEIAMPRAERRFALLSDLINPD